MKNFILKHLLIFKTLSLILGTIIMFIALFFSDKEFNIQMIVVHKSDKMMYLCLLLSFAFSFWVNCKLFKMKKSR